MSRFALAAGLVALFATASAAQNMPPKPLDFEGLGKLVGAAGFKSEAGQGVFKVTLPGEDGWFLEVWLSKSAPMVLVTFPCQGLPSGKVDPASLLKVLAYNGRIDGAYFGFNEKTRNFYLESTVLCEGLTGLKLRAEFERLQKLAIQTADLWDTSKWPVEKEEKK